MSDSRSQVDDTEGYHFNEDEHDATSNDQAEHIEGHEPIIERAHDDDGIGAKLIKFVKEYGLYLGIAGVVIVPAVFQLKDTFLGPSKAAPVARQSLIFTETRPPATTPAPAAASAETPSINNSAQGTIQRPADPMAVLDAPAAPASAPKVTPDATAALLPPSPANGHVAIPASGVAAAATTSADPLVTRIDTLEKSLSTTGDQIKALVNEQVVAGNEAQFKALNLRISSMGEAITELSRQLYNQQQVIAQIQQGLTAHAAVQRKRDTEEVPAMSRGGAPTEASVKTKWTLDAAIPGRAWLMGAEGETATVTEGDEIPGYGRVTKIDSLSGIVVTTSGKVIKAIDS